jgi:hypothetical protein
MMEQTIRQKMEQWSERELACFAWDAARILDRVRQDPTESAEERASWAHLVQLCLAVLKERRAATLDRESEPGKEEGA